MTTTITNVTTTTATTITAVFCKTQKSGARAVACVHITSRHSMSARLPICMVLVKNCGNGMMPNLI